MLCTRPGREVVAATMAAGPDGNTPDQAYFNPLPIRMAA